MEIKLYTPSDLSLWDKFVDESKNGTFLLKRGYMDYHADRFPDSSFLFYDKGKLRAILPASIKGDSLFSHNGLTYGGLIMAPKTTAEEVLTIFDLVREFCTINGIKELLYKPVPYIYHKMPAQEDLYALFRQNARLTVRNISSVVEQSYRLRFRDIRKAGIRKAGKAGIHIEESNDFEGFWKILEENLLNRYNTSPVHSLEEIKHLASLFPDQIKLYLSKKQNDILGGVVIYLTSHVAHCQYISATQQGKESGALDLLFDHLVNERFQTTDYFDFGTSNEQQGKILNEQLIYQKEGFGGRAVCYDTYQILY